MEASAYCEEIGAIEVRRKKNDGSNLLGGSSQLVSG